MVTVGPPGSSASLTDKLNVNTSPSLARDDDMALSDTRDEEGMKGDVTSMMTLGVGS